MEKILKRFERYVSYVLIVIVMAYISFQIIVLIWESFKSYSTRIEQAGLDYTQMYGKNIFVIFFNILLALEVLETVRIYEKDHDIKIRIILLVCVIAVSRKILSLDLHLDSTQAEFAISALLVSLSIAYFLIHNAPATTKFPGKNINRSNDT